MKVFRAQAEISASPQTIWDILVDGEHYPQWDPNIERIEGQIEPGESLAIYTTLRPHQPFNVRVAWFLPGQHLSWRSVMPFGMMIGERSFLIKALTNGSTSFEVREEFRGWLQPLLGLAIPDLTPTFESFVAGLKSRAEAKT